MKIVDHPNFTKGLHVFVWLLLLVVPAFFLRGHDYFHLPPQFFLVTNLFHIGLFYLNAYFLYPRLMTKKRWPLYPIALAVLFGLSYFLKILYIGLFPGHPMTPENREIVVFPVIPFLIASIIFRLISDRIKHERKEKEARTERLDSELKFLRSQVSPHFLFNMLTNMVALARQKSDLLEPSLIRLSELLRYMLYDSQEGKITLTKEIEYLNNYVDLQQLRFGEELKIDLQLDNDCFECELEPMLLVPFVENAFKHGVGLIDNPFIQITLKAGNNRLDFTVVNNYNPANTSKDKNKGIGIKNVRTRLDLLYPGRYTLQMEDVNETFYVHLNLEL